MALQLDSTLEGRELTRILGATHEEPSVRDSPASNREVRLGLIEFPVAEVKLRGVSSERRELVSFDGQATGSPPLSIAMPPVVSH